ncbi:MAG: hypothetical protein KKH04_16085 [Proteobacteria bacterium]|nr:hypothetical protein [Pseudomonadota bacterium]
MNLIEVDLERIRPNLISVAYEGCLECGSCRIGCPHLNIEWRFPRGDTEPITY